MGCTSSKPQSPPIDTICQYLIKTISDSIASSYKNKGVLEPAYYLLNFILEKKKSSQPLLQAFQDLQTNLPMILNQQPMDENALKQHLNRINDACAPLYPTEKFDLAGKIKAVENIANNLKEDVVKEFFLNEGAQFWNKSFPNKDIISFEGFYEKFAVSFKDVFESVVPEAHKPNLKAITENLKILMRDYLESDNNRFVMKEAWNVFHFKILTDYEMKVKFVESALVTSELQHNGIILKYIYSKENLAEPIEYHISENGLDKNGFDNTSKAKDLTSQRECIKIGRHKDQNDIILSLGDVSRQHCEIVMKQSLKGKMIRNDFYICNKSTSYIFFVVEEKGYQLGEKIIFNLSENRNFFVNSIYPGFKYKEKYYSVEPQYLEHKRKTMGNNFRSEQKPFLDLQCLEDHNLDQKFEAPEDNDFTISIGSGPNDTMVVHDIKKGEDADEEDVENMRENHCYIKYDSQEKCWVIQDRTVVLPGNVTFYKTLIKCEREGQYEDAEGITMRGIKLVSGMKFYISNNVFQVVEVEKA